jgi:hypothetical protein
MISTSGEIVMKKRGDDKVLSIESLIEERNQARPIQPSSDSVSRSHMIQERIDADRSISVRDKKRLNQIINDLGSGPAKVFEILKHRAVQQAANDS